MFTEAEASRSGFAPVGKELPTPKNRMVGAGTEMAHLRPPSVDGTSACRTRWRADLESRRFPSTARPGSFPAPTNLRHLSQPPNTEDRR